MRYFAMIFFIAVLLITPAFAAETNTEPDVLTPSYQTNTQTVTVHPDPVAVPDLDSNLVSRSPFLSALESIFGEYEPRTYSVTTYLSDGSAVTSTEVVPGLAGLDWVWISGVVLFGMFLFCLMRFLGGAVK